MLAVAAAALIATGLWAGALWRHLGTAPAAGQVSLWLWVTVLTGNFACALAEGRVQARGDALRTTRGNVVARRTRSGRPDDRNLETVPAGHLRKGDYVVCETGDIVPRNGEIVSGIASVDESAITGESAPVIRESGGDRSTVTAGTKVLSDRIVIRIASNPGETFIDRMLGQLDESHRQRTPGEHALAVRLWGMVVVSLLLTVMMHAFVAYGLPAGTAARVPTVLDLVAFLVCLMPTPIAALLSPLSLAAMERVMRHNVLAMSGKALEAAADVSLLLLDKTGTMTVGDRHAVAFLPLPGVSAEELATACLQASLIDETPEGRSIVSLAREQYGLRSQDLQPRTSDFVPFTPESRISGVNLQGSRIRKGASDAIKRVLLEQGGRVPPELDGLTAQVASQGDTPLVVSLNDRALGVIHLRDEVKSGLRPRFERLRAMGVRTVMLTGDNPLTARTISEETGVDDYLADSTPQAKLQLIRKEQAGGRLVAMSGDGTNDAPALAQADVGIAMRTGTPAAKEAATLIDLDSDPTKLVEITETGRQLLRTRQALTTFSVTKGVGLALVLVPTAFIGREPHPEAYVAAAVVVNALLTLSVLPAALEASVAGPAWVVRRARLVYGAAGLLVAPAGVWLVARLLLVLRLV